MNRLEREYANQRKKLIVDRSRRVKKSFEELFQEIFLLLKNTEIKQTKSFSWKKNLALEKRIDTIIGRLTAKLTSEITGAQVMAWNLANMKNTDLVLQYLANIKLNDPDIKKPFLQTNLGALTEFVNRTQNGLTLSERVWNIGAGIKEQLYTYLGNGVATGQSAKSMARDVKPFLRNPDRQFRRVRDKNGNLVLSRSAREYHPGRGVYRNSLANALRLTKNETNIAYHMADYTRRQQLTFVKGIEVKTSASHPVTDICDSLAGKYPKNFVFKGWHVGCLCYTTAILMSRDEFLQYLKDGSIPKKRVIKTIPDNAKNWLIQNREKLLTLNSLPYFIRDNKEVKKLIYEMI